MSALDRLLAFADDDLLCAFFTSLHPPAAALLSAVCKGWATAAELCLQVACRRHSWSLPRRARLQQRGTLALPWRGVYVARACRACMAVPGDFAVRSPVRALAT